MAAHDDKPLPYEARIRDTKGVAQRLDLDYLQRPSRFRDLRRKLTWIAPAAAVVLATPFVLGVWKTERVFSNGPVSPAHAVFGDNCKTCHVQAFSSVANEACLRCHDGPSHPTKAIEAARQTPQPRDVPRDTWYSAGPTWPTSGMETARAATPL